MSGTYGLPARCSGGRPFGPALRSWKGGVSAVTCLVYPAGIPVVVPGERFDASSRPIVDYLRLFERWEERFPGLENEVQGVVRERAADGSVRFTVSCVAEWGRGTEYLAVTGPSALPRGQGRR